MVNPQFQEQKAVSLVEVKTLLDDMEKRDAELNYRANKAKEYLAHFVELDMAKKDELLKKILALNQTRLKEEHIMKIVDFLPTTSDELKIILQSYPLSLPKKDMDAILAVVKEFA